MRVSTIGNSFSTQYNFKKKSNYNLEKDLYVNAQTKDLENLTMGMAFLTLTSETIERSDILGKERKSKLPLVLLSLTLALVVITAIKKFQFSNKYDSSHYC